MDQTEPRRSNALAIVNDLFFHVKLEGAAREAGWTMTFAHNAGQARTEAQKQPQLIVLDLNLAGEDALAIARELKNDEQTQSIPLMAYVSHVQVELRKQGAEAGCDPVIARSAVSSSLPDILRQHDTAER